MLSDWHERLRLVNKSRQLGFSQTFAAEAYWKAKYRGPRRILCVSRNLDSAQEFMSYVAGFCGEGDLDGDGNKTALTFRNGSRIKAEAATQKAGRSFAASDVYLDEFAHAPWQLAIYQSVRPTIATGGTMTVFSSPKGRANLFYQLWAGRMGREQWARYRYDWSWLWDAAWESEQRATMTREAFAEEYGADFIESGGALFRQEDIDACYAATLLSERAPRPGRDYLFAADVAGPGEDATVCQVWDVTERPVRLVLSDRWTSGPYERFYQRAAGLVAAWGIRDIWIDATGLGNPMVEETERRVKQRVEGFTFTRSTKEAALTALQLLVQQYAIAFDDPQLKTELELYQRDDDDLVTDCVMAAAIMAYALSNRPSQGVY